MAKLHIKPDCGNAPRKTWLIHFWDNILSGKKEMIEASVDQSVQFISVGKQTVIGMEHTLQAIVSSPAWKAKGIWIESIITHGAEAAVSGKLYSRDGRFFQFCEIYQFKSAGSLMLKCITSFMIRDEAAG